LKLKNFSDIKKEKAFQNKEFLKLLDWAVKHSVFYREFYKNVKISEIRSLGDIKKLPVLDKETLRKHIKDVYTINPKKGILCFTGGTTGKSLCVVRTKKDEQKRMAYLDFFKLKHGFVNIKMKSARFNGKNIIPLGQKGKCFWRDNIFIKQRIYSSFHISQNNIPYYIDNLNKFKPVVIDGFVTSIYEVAKYMKEHSIKPQFKLLAVFPTSETVLPIHREVISEVFGCPVRDQYASSEGAPFITECTEGYMHENIDTGVFEHVKTGNGTKLIVTSFSSYGTPLIRYDIGDNVIESDSDNLCKCNSSHPIVKGIDGRKAEYLVSKERGNINLGNLSNIVKELPNCVEKIQFIQNNIDQIEIYMVIDRNLYKSEYDQLILKEMTYRFGEKMSFKLIKVRDIAREKSGKYCMIKNNIK